MLAIILALEHFEFIIGGLRVTLLTDHQPLSDLVKAKDPRHRIARWIWRLLEFDVHIDYIKGKLNFSADFLSRCQSSNA